MKTFTDNSGRAWSVCVNVDAIKRVRSLVNVDLLGIVGGDLVDRLRDDAVLLVDVIYALCKPEADAKSITDQDFGRGMSGDSVEAATTALLEELVDFFPKAKRRLLRKALEMERAAQAAALKAAEERLDRIGVGTPSTVAPASVVSTPAP